MPDLKLSNRDKLEMLENLLSAIEKESEGILQNERPANITIARMLLFTKLTAGLYAHYISVLRFFGISRGWHHEPCELCTRSSAKVVELLDERGVRIREHTRQAQGTKRAIDWLMDHMEDAWFTCDCEPSYESDTNAYNHTDDCASSMQLHIDATLANLEKASE